MSGLASVSNQTPDTTDKTTNGDKPSKKEGNLESGGQKPKESKTSRRTTSLLNLFMSNSQGMCENFSTHFFLGGINCVNPHTQFQVMVCRHST